MLHSGGEKIKKSEGLEDYLKRFLVINGSPKDLIEKSYPISLETQSQYDSKLNAAVDVIGGAATNAVIIPLGALRDLGDGTYGVFVRDNSGKFRFRTVTIGIQDLTNVEITSGLQAGEIVSTGL